MDASTAAGGSFCATGALFTFWETVHRGSTCCFRRSGLGCKPLQSKGAEHDGPAYHQGHPHTMNSLYFQAKWRLGRQQHTSYYMHATVLPMEC
jgi:hypothetical protein